ncbi:pilus assembly protein N-terminal domain-containing protein [Caulobacter sp. DWR1-3-2b1]|uniref:pilus assembly protein N-terminal domain-containing protein n=1 Tax=Caulobacter sp. DWR1-3-2b1 TaxID=2804670 RepID=UPI003CF32A2E
MRRLSLALAAILALTAATAHAQSLAVPAGEAVRIALDGAVRDVVVGDPLVADVSVINERTLIIMGKRPGITTVMAFDGAGRSLADRQVQVSDNGAAITIYRGNANVGNYACGVQCTRIPLTSGAGVP